MPQSKIKCWYSSNCLHFLKRAVPLTQRPWGGIFNTICVWFWAFCHIQSNHIATECLTPLTTNAIL